MKKKQSVLGKSDILFWLFCIVFLLMGSKRTLKVVEGFMGVMGVQFEVFPEDVKELQALGLSLVDELNLANDLMTSDLCKRLEKINRVQMKLADSATKKWRPNSSNLGMRKGGIVVVASSGKTADQVCDIIAGQIKIQVCMVKKIKMIMGRLSNEERVEVLERVISGQLIAVGSILERLDKLKGKSCSFVSELIDVQGVLVQETLRINAASSSVLDLLNSVLSAQRMIVAFVCELGLMRVNNAWLARLIGMQEALTNKALQAMQSVDLKKRLEVLGFLEGPLVDSLWWANELVHEIPFDLISRVIGLSNDLIKNFLRESEGLASGEVGEKMVGLTKIRQNVSVLVDRLPIEQASQFVEKEVDIQEAFGKRVLHISGDQFSQVEFLILDWFSGPQRNILSTLFKQSPSKVLTLIGRVEELQEKVVDKAFKVMEGAAFDAKRSMLENLIRVQNNIVGIIDSLPSGEVSVLIKGAVEMQAALIKNLLQVAEFDSLGNYEILKKTLGIHTTLVAQIFKQPPSVAKELFGILLIEQKGLVEKIKLMISRLGSKLSAVDVHSVSGCLACLKEDTELYGQY